MNTIPGTLPNDVSELKKMLADKLSEIEALKSRCQYLEEQFLKARQQQFGKSSEAHPAQGDLFNEAEQTFDELPAEEKETITYSRNKPKRKPLPKDLPREVVVHDIDDAEKVCDCCGGELHNMGEDKSEQLEFIPAQIKVIEHVRPKYSCRHCEKADTQVRIKQAPVPLSPIPKSIATPSLLAQIITHKYQYALPLYRQEKIFQQHGIELNRKTMSAWMLKCTELFKPIIEHWHHLLLQQSVVQADETTLNVLSDDNSKSYMWLYCSGGDSPAPQCVIPNIVLYDYQPSRSGQCAVNFLQGYSGYLQVDGFKGYDQTDAQLVGCWTHARRQFVEAEKIQGKNKTGKIHWALNHIQKLYRIETLIKDKTPEEKYHIRQTQSKPLLVQYRQWCEKSIVQVPPKSAVGKAINYSLNQWDKLIRYIDDGQLNIDNNRAERAIKPFVIGRKNWLFANTANGANASAVLYSIVETAKANGLTPFYYITFLLEELPKSPDDIEYLMPWNVELTQ